MLPLRVSGNRPHLGTDGTGGSRSYPTDLRAGALVEHAEDILGAPSTGQVHFHPDERPTMNASRQRVVNQCRKQGMSVLTKAEFESAFLFAADARKLDLRHFCLSNDLELIVDPEAGRFFFLPAQPEARDGSGLPA